MTLYDVSGARGGKSYLLIGAERTALFDAGMAFSGDALVTNVAHMLQGRPLDYVFLSHSHYDHISGVPALRVAWPEVVVLGAAYAANVLQKPKAQATIAGLNRDAAIFFTQEPLAEYDPALLVIDCVVGDDEVIDLGGDYVRVIVAPGHTKCSLAFYINDEVLIAAESTGYSSAGGRMHHAYASSYQETLASIAKCRALAPAAIIESHYGFVPAAGVADYWDRSLAHAQAVHDFIIAAYQEKGSVEAVVFDYLLAYNDPYVNAEQPINAALLNTQGMVGAVLAGR